MFGTTLVLGVSIAFLIQHPHSNAIKPEDSDPNPDSEEVRLAYAISSAKWTVSGSLSVVLVCQTIIALLSRSLDDPKTLKVNNRYLRMLPRLLVIAVAVFLPIDRSLTVIPFLGILAPVCFICILWEWWASLEKEGGFIEP